MSARAHVTVLDAILLSATLLAAFALKRWYTTATAEDLGWLLEPATSLVERATGEPFVREARVGFVAEKLPIVVAPACAGVNFFVIAHLTWSFGFTTRLRSPRAKILWFSAAPLFAYAATLVANTARITAAIWIRSSGVRVPVLSPPEVHRALGVVVYLTALFVLFAVAERLAGSVVREH